jgi:hypothetical protein
MLMLLEWFEMTFDQLMTASKKVKKGQKEAAARIGTILGECFQAVSEFFVFNSETLAMFVDLIDDANWKFHVFLGGVGRMQDI